MRKTPADIEQVLAIAPQESYGLNRREIWLNLLESDNALVLMPDEKSMTVLVYLGKGEWESHNEGSKESILAVIKWMFENTDCKALSWRNITPAHERLARRYDKMIGAEVVGDRHVLRRESCLLL